MNLLFCHANHLQTKATKTHDDKNYYPPLRIILWV